jgi:hypothetical protein
MGIWRLKAIRKNVEIGICLICRKEQELSHILRCDGKKCGGKKFWIRDFGISIQKYELGR